MRQTEGELLCMPDSRSHPHPNNGHGNVAEDVAAAFILAFVAERRKWRTQPRIAAAAQHTLIVKPCIILLFSVVGNLTYFLFPPRFLSLKRPT